MPPRSYTKARSWIPAGTPLARAGGWEMLLRATGGNPLGAAVLAAIARKESEFGKTGRLPRYNNYWGYGIHASPSIYSAPSVEAMARRVWSALKDPKGYYLGEGRKTLPDILMKYAPPSENNTRLYQQQTAQWMKEMGFNPNVNIFTGGGAAVAPPAQGGQSPAMNQPAGMPGGFAPQSIPLNWSKLQAINLANQRDILAGRTPSPQRLQKLLNIVNRSIPVARPITTNEAITTPQGPQASRGQGHMDPSEAFHWGPRETFGFKTGGVDSGSVVFGGTGGNWGGSLPRALAVAKAIGMTPSSQKRSRKYTASGGISDHWSGSTNSYAVDLPTSGSAGDKKFRQLMRYLAALSGQKPIAGTGSGKWHNFEIGGYRYQVGWRVSGHYDHIHVGVEKR